MWLRKVPDELPTSLKYHCPPSHQNSQCFLLTTLDLKPTGAAEGTFGGTWMPFSRSEYRPTRILDVCFGKVLETSGKRSEGRLLVAEGSARSRIVGSLAAAFGSDWPAGGGLWEIETFSSIDGSRLPPDSGLLIDVGRSWLSDSSTSESSCGRRSSVAADPVVLMLRCALPRRCRVDCGGSVRWRVMFSSGLASALVTHSVTSGCTALVAGAVGSDAEVFLRLLDGRDAEEDVAGVLAAFCAVDAAAELRLPVVVVEVSGAG